MRRQAWTIQSSREAALCFSLFVLEVLFMAAGYCRILGFATEYSTSVKKFTAT